MSSMTRNPDLNDGLAPEDPAERKAREVMAEPHGRAREMSIMKDSDIVNNDVKPKQRAAAEQRAKEQKKYEKTHAEQPEPQPETDAQQYGELDQHQRAHALEDVVARHEVKHTTQRLRKDQEHLFDKALQRDDVDRARERMGFDPE